MKVIIVPEVDDYFTDLVETLYQKEYFGFRASARRYVTELLDAIRDTLPNRLHKPAPRHFDPESDVDLIVAFRNMPVEEYADNYFDFKFSLQDILQRPVDLLEQQAIRNPYFLQTIDKTKQLIYGRAN